MITRTRRTAQPSGSVRDAIMRASAGDDEGIAAPFFAELIEAMISVDPAKRITAADVLCNSFFQDKHPMHDRGVLCEDKISNLLHHKQ